MPGSPGGECLPYNTDEGPIWWSKIFNERLSLSLEEAWHHKSSHVVEARGSLGKLSAKAHGPYGEKTKKKKGVDLIIY